MGEGIIRASVTRVALVVIMAAVILFGGAATALADPAAPTNYESTVLDVDPDPGVAVFSVTGGDAFLEVRVAPGHNVDIPGYFGEPYIRVDESGVVWINEDSPALYINEDRYGGVSAPEGVDGEGEPRWQRVGSDGTYAWHDHRVHWMSRDLPPVVDGDVRELVFPWRLPVVIDGVDVVVAGELVWLPSLHPIGPLLAGLLALVPLTLSKRVRFQASAFLVGVAATIAILTAVAQNNGTPVPARGFPVWVVIPLVALAAAAWAVTRGRLGTFPPTYLMLLGGVLLGTWAVSVIEVLTMPVLPSAIPAGVERFAVAFVLWAGVGVAAISVLETFSSTRTRKLPVAG